MMWLGLDIGGANLKAATSAGWSQSVPFPLWRLPNELPQAIAALVAQAPVTQAIAVTMTGELCDCFCSKEEGVNHILNAVKFATAERTVRVYLVDGRLVDLATASKVPKLAAASNWRALAEFACRFYPKASALVLDVGSTTSDIIPIVDGRVAAIAYSDTERLTAGELIYAGVGRTPICAITDTLPWRGHDCPTAAEVFATTADAYLLLEKIAEDVQANWTADGRPLNFRGSRQRIARQICADAADIPEGDWVKMAGHVYEKQCRRLASSIARVTARLPTLPEEATVTGAGEFLARAAIQTALPTCQISSLSDRAGQGVTRCAPAYALALLASEKEGGA